LSTSKTVAVLWTYSVASALLSIVIAKWMGHGHAYGEQVKNGLQGEYALLIGGPIGAAILSKGIVSNQVAGGASKPEADAAQAVDLVTGDTGQTDLGDLQYILFNTVALVFFFGEFLSKPYAGLPTIPDVLLGLTSVSAVGYVAKKALPAGGLTITKVDPATAHAGDPLTLYVSGLAGAQGAIPDKGEVKIQLGTTDVDAQSISTTAEGPIVKLVVPPDFAKGTWDVTISYDDQKTTLKGALKIS
jgi:hypothetical protein